MGDYTQFQLSILHCPGDQEKALSEVLQDEDLAFGWDGVPACSGEVHLGSGYTHRFTTGAYPSELAPRLVTAAPDAAWQAWTDPTPYWLGELVRYVPTLGLHQADCTDTGDAVFTERAITEALRAGPDALTALLGTAWTTALRPYEDRLPQVGDGQSGRDELDGHEPPF